MNDLIINVCDNILKLGIVDEKGFAGVSAEISPEVCAGTKILNTQAFSQIVSDLLPSVTSKPKNKLYLNFVLEPSDSYLFFATVNKKDGEAGDQILEEIKHKLEGVTLEELYYNYQKIAPFVYQFVGYKKSYLDSLFEVSTQLGIVLKSAISWPLILPKYVSLNEPAIFISQAGSKQIVILSELGGVFFIGSFDKEKSPEELKALIHELSVYKRTTPINKVYSFNYASFTLDPNYDYTEVSVPNQDLANAKGYESLLLVKYMLDFGPDIASGQINFVNLIPVPVVEKKPVALVYAGIAAAFILITGVAAFFGYTKHKSSINKNQLAQNTQPNGAVLSENVETTQSTVSAEKPDLKKSDLTMRIENGAGIPGIAAKSKEYFEKLGYKVSDIGNSEETGKAETIVKFNKAKISFKDLLLLDMKDNYPSIVVKDDLEDGKGYDVLITVGTDVKGF